MNSRRAASIVELLVIMSACTVVLTLCGVLLQRAMHIQMRSRARADVERSALRLSDQFRRDVHQARAAQTGNADPGNGPFLQLQFVGEQTVEYSHLAGTVRRVLAKNGQPLSREEFVFTPDSEVVIREDGSPPRLLLTITAEPKEMPSRDIKQPVAAAAIPVSFQVEAALGRDWRFAAAATRQEQPQ
jgi:hypothetical protein